MTRTPAVAERDRDECPLQRPRPGRRDSQTRVCRSPGPACSTNENTRGRITTPAAGSCPLHLARGILTLPKREDAANSFCATPPVAVSPEFRAWRVRELQPLRGPRVDSQDQQAVDLPRHVSEPLVGEPRRPRGATTEICRRAGCLPDGAGRARARRCGARASPRFSPRIPAAARTGLNSRPRAICWGIALNQRVLGSSPRRGTP